MWLLPLILACKPELQDRLVPDSPAGGDSAPESAPPDDSAGPMPDLALGQPRKEGQTLVVPYCNEGEIGGTTSISVRLMDVDTTAAHEWGGNPYPAPGECVEARPADCADLGLDCAAEVMIEAVIDPYDAVHESDESDNRGTFRL